MLYKEIIKQTLEHICNSDMSIYIIEQPTFIINTPEVNSNAAEPLITINHNYIGHIHGNTEFKSDGDLNVDGDVLSDNATKIVR